MGSYSYIIAKVFHLLVKSLFHLTNQYKRIRDCGRMWTWHHSNGLNPKLLPATGYLSKIEVEFTELQELAQWDARDNYRALLHRVVRSNLIKQRAAVKRFRGSLRQLTTL